LERTASRSSLAGHHAKVFQRPRQRDGANRGVRRLIED
jgi:DNA (cytosine-5)-methyltransferase 1